MATTLDSRPSATTFDVEELVTMAWDGRIRVPHFQRDFRWGLDDVRKLFDSIVKGYPIGSLLLWTRRAPAQTLRLGALTIEAAESADALWVVDGQQRLTSIANALHLEGQRDPRFALSYDLRTGDFVKTPQNAQPQVIPLSVVFNLQEILRWFSKYPEISDRLDEATSVTRKIRQFEVPAYLVSQERPEVLQDIFDRMNNYGKRLSRAEIFSALNAGDELHINESLTFERIAEKIDTDLLFGKIDNDTVLASVLARRGAEVRRDIRHEFTQPNDEGRDAAYRAGEEALRRAVTFLQREAGVPHISMLAYRYLLVVLTRVFAFYPDPDPRISQLLRRWYWQAAVAGPEQFKGGTPNAARVLCSQVQEPAVSEHASLSESVEGLLATVRGDAFRLPDLSRFATNEAATKMVLCVWWAAGPRQPETGEPYEQASLADSLLEQKTARDAVRYLVPRSTVPVKYRKWAANRALMPYLELDPKEVTGRIVQRPTAWKGDQWTEMLRSHALAPEMGAMLTEGDITGFLETRQALLQVQFENYVGRMSEREIEDTPPLADLTLDEDEDAEE